MSHMLEGQRQGGRAYPTTGTASQGLSAWRRHLSITTEYNLTVIELRLRRGAKGRNSCCPLDLQGDLDKGAPRSRTKSIVSSHPKPPSVQHGRLREKGSDMLPHLEPRQFPTQDSNILHFYKTEWGSPSAWLTQLNLNTPATYFYCSGGESVAHRWSDLPAAKQQICGRGKAWLPVPGLFCYGLALKRDAMTGSITAIC